VTSWLNRDEEIRAISVKVALQYSGLATAGFLASGKTPTVICPFEIVTDIEKYIKEGTLPEPIVVERTEVTK
jgi:hypothetical protein